MTDEAPEKVNTPIFVRSEVDDLGLSIEAFRVYGHLARRAGADNNAWPSYQTIGDVCFRGGSSGLLPETRRRKAIKAVKELEALNLISVERRSVQGKKEHATNRYHIQPMTKWDKSVRPKKKP